MDALIKIKTPDGDSHFLASRHIVGFRLGKGCDRLGNAVRNCVVVQTVVGEVYDCSRTIQEWVALWDAGNVTLAGGMNKKLPARAGTVKPS